MTVRSRSWTGALIMAFGVILMVVALLTAKVVEGVPQFRSGLLWTGTVLATGGVGLILWAFAGAVRQIGASEVKLEERLKAEADAQRSQKRPG